MRQVHICEVGPRDGLQNAKHLMPTEAKKRWISALATAGLEEIEVGSFVPLLHQEDTARVLEDYGVASCLRHAPNRSLTFLERRPFPRVRHVFPKC